MLLGLLRFRPRIPSRFLSSDNSRPRIPSRFLSSDNSRPRILQQSSDMPHGKHPSFYVVTNGFSPGIYRTYEEVLEQVTGYDHGSFNKFTSYDDAYLCYFHNRNEELVNNEKISENFVKCMKQGLANQQKKKAQQNKCNGGGSGGLNGSGGLIESGGLNGSIRKEDICNTEVQTTEDTVAPPVAEMGSLQSETPSIDFHYEESCSLVRKSSRVKHPVKYDDSENYLEQFEKDLLQTIACEELRYSRKRKRRRVAASAIARGEKADATVTKDGYQIIYTDGSCENNRAPQDQRRAGCGVFWGTNDPRNISERLWGSQTNQRAELWAAVRAVQSALQSNVEDVEIRTDSRYVIMGMTEWIVKWRQNNFTSTNRKPVVNKDIFMLLDNLCQYVDVRWLKVKAHSAVLGNEMADELAKCGATRTERVAPLVKPELANVSPSDSDE